MIAYLLAAHQFAQASRLAAKEAAERRTIARAFNDRYTYRRTYGPGLEYAWMCPTCNLVHTSIQSDFQWLTGNHFPACCEHTDGHRCLHGIRSC